MNVTALQGDITEQKVDVIVNAANSTLLGGGGVDAAIHQAAGPELLAACKRIVEKSGNCPAGEAVITPGYNLPAEYVIHTVGPIWKDGEQLEPNKLASCYWKSLDLAASKCLKSIAFPNISTGVYRFPKEKAAEIALYTVKEWIWAEPGATLTDIRFICFDQENYELYQKMIKINNF